MQRHRKHKLHGVCYFSWPPVVTAHDRKKLTRTQNSSESYCLLYLEFSFFSIISYHSLQIVKKKISDQNRLCYLINLATFMSRSSRNSGILNLMELQACIVIVL